MLVSRQGPAASERMLMQNMKEMKRRGKDVTFYIPT